MTSVIKLEEYILISHYAMAFPYTEKTALGNNDSSGSGRIFFYYLFLVFRQLRVVRMFVYFMGNCYNMSKETM